MKFIMDEKVDGDPKLSAGRPTVKVTTTDPFGVEKVVTTKYDPMLGTTETSDIRPDQSDKIKEVRSEIVRKIDK